MVNRFTGGHAIWLASAIGLSGLIVYQVSGDLWVPRVIAASNNAAAVHEAPAAPLPVTLPSKSRVDDIASRPLFSPSRRPSILATVAKAGEHNPTWQLVGTMLAGAAPVALLRHPKAGVLRLRQGEKIDDWTVTAIDGTHVSLENGEHTKTLWLQAPAAPARLVGDGTTGRGDGDRDRVTSD